MQNSVDLPRGIKFEWPERFTARDIQEYVALLNQVVRTTGTNGYSKELSLEDGQRLFEGMEFAISRGEGWQLFVRNEAGSIVGAATLLCFKQADRKHVVEACRVAVALERRGEFLMAGWREVLRRLEEMGIEIIVIDVSEDGPLRLWERLGFRTWGVMKDYSRVGTRQLNGYYMAVYVRDAKNLHHRKVAAVTG